MFRTEEKVLLNISDYLKIINLIKDSGGRQIYPSREIESIYFDDKNFTMYNESEDGTLPRYKIRLRRYPKIDLQQWFYEKKINSIEGKFKKTNSILENEKFYLSKYGINDKIYGNCYPKLTVKYIREYYSIKDERITLDKNLKYVSHNSKMSIDNNENLILEMKSQTNIFYETLFAKLQSKKERISKYCSAVDALYGKNIQR
jgi:SPX domain protein involved in polyphosphate accumulation